MSRSVKNTVKDVSSSYNRLPQGTSAVITRRDSIVFYFRLTDLNFLTARKQFGLQCVALGFNFQTLL